MYSYTYFYKISICKFIQRKLSYYKQHKLLHLKQFVVYRTLFLELYLQINFLQFIVTFINIICNLFTFFDMVYAQLLLNIRLHYQTYLVQTKIIKFI